MKAIWTPDALVARGQPADEFLLNANSVSEIVVPGTKTVVYQNDRVIDRESSATTENSALCERIGQGPVLFESLTPAVCSAPPSQGQKPGFVANGNCIIQGTDPRGQAWGRRNLEIPLSRVGGATVDSVRFGQSNDPASLRQHLITALYAAIAGKLPSALNCDLYASANYGDTKAASLNPGMVFDSSKFSFLTFSNTPASAACFISPRHAIYARHTGNYQQVTVRRKDGSFQTVNRVASLSMANDFGMTVYDQDVTGIDYVELLPASFVQKTSLPFQAYGAAKPVAANLPAFGLYFNPGLAPDTPYPINTNYSRHFRIINFDRYSTGFNTTPIPGTNIQTQDGNWNAAVNEAQAYQWTAQGYGGDSSTPVFFWINNKPALASVFYSTGSGPWIPQLQPYLADLMNQLALQAGISNPNYAPVWADLSMFPSYP